jgi:hypothetical protein
LFTLNVFHLNWHSAGLETWMPFKNCCPS